MIFRPAQLSLARLEKSRIVVREWGRNVPSYNETTNLLVQAMSPADRAALMPHFVRVPLVRGEPIITAGERIEHVCFPERGIATVVATADTGRQTEVGIFGCEGMSGLSVLLGSDMMPVEAATQVGGGTALRIHVDHLTNTIEQSAPLRTLLLRFCHSFMMQAATSAMANAQCNVGSRIARWLLMCHDRMGGDAIPLTHQHLARMVNADRTSITHALHVLEGEHMISATRGSLVIKDRAKLLQLADGTYGRAEAEYTRLIAPFGKE